MNVIDTGKLALLALGRGGNILADAVGDRRGTSLPFAADTVATPQMLNQLINAHGVAPRAGPANICAVRQLDIPSISSNCNNLVLAIEQQGAPVLPDSLFVKLPLPSLVTRWFFSIIGSWDLESLFFSRIADTVPLRTPVTYATASQGTRFFLIQENLQADPTVQLFTNPDMLAGPSLDVARRCLDAFARLHACHYGIDEKQREAILPLEHHPFLAPRMRLVTQTLNGLALRPCMKKLPGRIPPAVAEIYKKTQRYWGQLLDYWFSGQLSLLHGDSHLGNFFISGDEMGMLDFQAVHWGKGMRDVHYFLVDALPADVLSANEQALVRYYAERRGHYGSAIDFDASWQEYRSFSYHTLMTIVVAIGFGALNQEQDALMEEILTRAVAAVERLDYAGWLDDFLAS